MCDELKEKELLARIDFLQKIITRTDGFLNYANTKSTIILTFITAITAAICTNTGSALKYIDDKGHADIAVVFKSLVFLSIVFLLFAFYFVVKTIIPYVKKSPKRNFYSFIDTVEYYSSEGEYCSDFSNVSKSDIFDSLISLQYNLSKGLVEKYKNHKRSIICIISACFILFLDMLLVFMI
ncbi:hypothetical protein DAX92_07590 [Salmonella enterica subsp. enterica]|uniref:Pycsar effector protein domain-containing protein n=1 Tax=Salmonella enterica I TaxID=59201 RepID=A0A7Z1TG26_SALET|nr:hypothetical protein [Salmonella enterica]EDX9153553.1 hypothetical protein [Salmonella enterica subsp. enterica serovar Sandiego]EAW3101955.1 hypothetical protein [Salmonella enterica]EAW4433707.1 hypothetical protein [Salmonella enterica]EBL0003670.1 hypothetical protein [Salmonella enterica]EIC7816869.1 hypothetical protein [Salmonella enterica]